MRALRRAPGEVLWAINEICDGNWTRLWESRHGICSRSWRARAR